MKKLCLLATGGTIASVAGENGLHPGLTGEGLLERVPELARFGAIEVCELLALDSTNLLPEHWQTIAREIARLYDRYDGFVVTHGTDTMGYTAGALYYMLENIAKPVVLTGSMLPLVVAGTDARENLLGAFAVAASGRAGVYQAFAGRVIYGNAVKKINSHEADAFRSVGRPQAGSYEVKAGGDEAGTEADRPFRLATLGTSSRGGGSGDVADGRQDREEVVGGQAREDERATESPGVVLRWVEAAPLSAGEFRLRDALDERVFVLTLVPGAAPALLDKIADLGYHAIVLVGYGGGGVPNEASPKNFLPAVRRVIGRGVRVICATQCPFGGTHMDAYEVGVEALQCGAEDAGTLPLEALVPRTMLELGRVD